MGETVVSAIALGQRVLQPKLGLQDNTVLVEKEIVLLDFRKGNSFGMMKMLIRPLESLAKERIFLLLIPGLTIVVVTTVHPAK